MYKDSPALIKNLCKLSLITAAVISLSACDGDDEPRTDINEHGENSGSQNIHKGSAVRLLIELTEDIPTGVTVSSAEIVENPTGPAPIITNTTWVNEKQLMEIPQPDNLDIRKIVIGNTIIAQPPKDLYLHLDPAGSPLPSSSLPDARALNCVHSSPTIELIDDNLPPATFFSELWIDGEYIDVTPGRVNLFSDVCQNATFAILPSLWVEEQLGIYGVIPAGVLFTGGRSYMLPAPETMLEGTVTSNLSAEFANTEISIQHYTSDNTRRSRIAHEITRSSPSAEIVAPYIPSFESPTLSRFEYFIDYKNSVEIDAPIYDFWGLTPANNNSRSILTASTQTFVSEDQINKGVTLNFPANPFVELSGGHGFFSLTNPDGTVRGDLIVVTANIENYIHAPDYATPTTVTAITAIDIERNFLKFDGLDPIGLVSGVGDDYTILSFSIIDYNDAHSYADALKLWSEGNLGYTKYTITAAADEYTAADM